MFIATFFRHYWIPGDPPDRFFPYQTIGNTNNLHPLIIKNRHFTVIKKNDIFRPGQKGRDVGCDKIFTRLFPEGHHQRTALPGDNHFPRLFFREYGQSVSTPGAKQRTADRLGKVGPGAQFPDNQVADNFSIGLRRKFMP